MDTLAEVSMLARVRKCRRVKNGTAGLVGIERRNGRCSYSGLQTCGSVWACPMCAAKVSAERGSRLAEAVSQHVENGGRIALATGTLRHHDGQALRGLLGAIAPAWKAATNDWSPRRRLRELGSIGNVRSVEVRHGANGWHPHLHALLFLGPEVDDAAVDGLERQMGTAWANAVQRAGYERPSDEHGFDVRLLNVGEALQEAAGYLVKQAGEQETAAAAARELTSAATKRGQSRGPFQILRDIQRWGDESDLLLWREYERATKGRKQVDSTRGLLDRLAPGVERTDEEIAADGDAEGVEVARLTDETFRGIASVPGRRGAVIYAAANVERDEDVMPLLTAMIRSWGLPDPLPPGGSLGTTQAGVVERAGARGTLPDRTPDTGPR